MFVEGHPILLGTRSHSRFEFLFSYSNLITNSEFFSKNSISAFVLESDELNKQVNFNPKHLETAKKIGGIIVRRI